MRFDAVILDVHDDVTGLDAAVGVLELAGLRVTQRASEPAGDLPPPHPAGHLATAAVLGVDPGRCLAVEDSVDGCVAAKAAGMGVVALPHPVERGVVAFGVADVVLTSAVELDASVLAALDERRPLPSLARPRFHLAFGVDDLDAARGFYVGVLGCTEGRSAETWVDFDLWGHQVVAHLDPDVATRRPPTNEVDGHAVPAHHFGLVLPAGAWSDLADRLRAADVEFVMEPTVRFAGLPGEQRTMFVLDPAGNAIELKSFADDRLVFSPQASSVEAPV